MNINVYCGLLVKAFAMILKGHEEQIRVFVKSESFYWVQTIPGCDTPIWDTLKNLGYLLKDKPLISVKFEQFLNELFES